jgi:hypothetical protein
VTIPVAAPLRERRDELVTAIPAEASRRGLFPFVVGLNLLAVFGQRVILIGQPRPNISHVKQHGPRPHIRCSLRHRRAFAGQPAIFV